ncbi:MAG: hypothetical protein P8X47_10870 [Ignavibacteriaceae bacterium]
MTQLQPSRNTTVNLSEFDGIISEKQSSIISVTKVVVAISVLLAIFMVLSK